MLPAGTATLCFPPETQTTNLTLKTEPDTTLTPYLSLSFAHSLTLFALFHLSHPRFWFCILLRACPSCPTCTNASVFCYNLALCHCDIWQIAYKKHYPSLALWMMIFRPVITPHTASVRSIHNCLNVPHPHTPTKHFSCVKLDPFDTRVMAYWILHYSHILFCHSWENGNRLSHFINMLFLCKWD